MAIQNARAARLIQVIEVVTKEGIGTTDDPVREVTRYHSTEGELLAVAEPSVLESEKSAMRFSTFFDTFDAINRKLAT